MLVTLLLIPAPCNREQKPISKLLRAAATDDRNLSSRRSAPQFASYAAALRHLQALAHTHRVAGDGAVAARHATERQREEAAAVTLQRVWRGARARAAVARLKAGVCALQLIFRAKKQRAALRQQRAWQAEADAAEQRDKYRLLWLQEHEALSRNIR